MSNNQVSQVVLLRSKVFDLRAKYSQGPVILVQSHYMDAAVNVPAWRLVEPETFSPICVATVNLEDYGVFPEPGQAFIKTWSENEGVLEALVTAGFITKVVGLVPAGYSTAAVVDIVGADSNLWEGPWDPFSMA